MSGSCVTISTVMPRSRLSAASSSMISRPRWVSRLPVGSSASSTVGFVTSARAIATRCCCPPDSSAGVCVSRPCRPTAARASRAARCRAAAGSPRYSSGSSTFSCALVRASRLKPWKTKPRCTAPQQRTLVAVEPVHGHAAEQVGAGARRVEAAEDVHGRGLARAAGPHDGDEFALARCPGRHRAAPAPRPSPGRRRGSRRAAGSGASGVAEAMITWRRPRSGRRSPPCRACSCSLVTSVMRPSLTPGVTGTARGWPPRLQHPDLAHLRGVGAGAAGAGARRSRHHARDDAAAGRRCGRGRGVAAGV